MVAQFYQAADKYNCTEALKFVRSYMTENVNIKSAVIYYEIAVLYDLLDLKKACEEVLFPLFY